MESNCGSLGESLKKFSLFSALLLAARYIFGSHVNYRVSIEQYPDVVSGKTSLDLFPKTRGFLHNDLSKCTGCGDCLGACLVGALEMNVERMPDGSQHVNEFRINLAKCYSCSACVNLCPVNSIYYTKDFELAVENEKDLVKQITPENNNGQKARSLTKDSVKIRTYEIRR